MLANQKVGKKRALDKVDGTNRESAKRDIFFFLFIRCDFLFNDIIILIASCHFQKVLSSSFQNTWYIVGTNCIFKKNISIEKK